MRYVTAVFAKLSLSTCNVLSKKDYEAMQHVNRILHESVISVNLLTIIKETESMKTNSKISGILSFLRNFHFA